MDGNKDDALKCLQIGREALELGDRTRALKFISKARCLDPNLPVEDLLSTLQGESNNAPASDSTTPTDEASSSTEPIGIPPLRRRVPSNGSTSSSRKDYTEKQILIVRQIRRQKDYYGILGLERSCSAEDVRKAYRKLSLKVHPDKNKAPGADEAFKNVSKAFQCLSDGESRKRYNLSGSEEVVYERAAASRRPQSFNGFYGADIDTEEIFRNFFFGGVPQATTQFGGFSFGAGMRPSERTNDHGSRNFNLIGIVQLLVFLIVLLSSILPSSTPIYALSRSFAYEYRFTTPKGVNYYVRTAKFEQEYPTNSPERIKLEVGVERDYFSILAKNCRVELQRRQWDFTRETPHCDRLKQIGTVG